MLTVYCGDNTVHSRSAFVQHRDNLLQKSYECRDISSGDILLIDSLIYGTASLFSPKQAYFTEGVLSKITNRKALKACYEDPEIEVVIWDGTLDQRDIKRYFPKAQIVASSFPTNLWKFLDSIAPGHAALLIQNKKYIISNVEESMLLYMLQRRIKDLILVEKSIQGKRALAPWQQQNMLSQSRSWGSTPENRLNNLHRMYHKLYDIEVGTKTSTLPYSIDQALDILFSFYLQ